MNVVKQVKGVALALTLVAAVTNSYGAASAQPFSVVEGSISGAAANTFTADKLNGSYNEIITLTPGVVAGTGTFATEAVFSAGSWTLGSSSALASQINGFGSAGYKIYALFAQTGTYSTNLSGEVTFTGSSPAAVQLYLDSGSDTSLSLGSAAIGNVSNISVTANSADALLASSTTFTAGTGHGYPFCVATTTTVCANGDYDILFSNLMLDSAGYSLFNSPNPFYVNVEVTGGFTAFNAVSATTYATNGTANVFFSGLPTTVPEPDALALAGLALAGAGVAAARRNSKR